MLRSAASEPDSTPKKIMTHPAWRRAAQGVVGIAQHDIHARLAPPAEIQRGDAAGQLAGVVLAQEEIVVVELHGVDAVRGLQVVENGGGAGGRLHFLAVVHRDHAAEVAAEGAADARLVDGGARSQERVGDVLRGIQAVVRRPGEIVGRFQRALGGVDVQSELVLEGRCPRMREKSRAPRSASISSSSVSSPWPLTTKSTYRALSAASV